MYEHLPTPSHVYINAIEGLSKDRGVSCQAAFEPTTHAAGVALHRQLCQPFAVNDVT